MRRRDTCRICDGDPVVSYLGLCRSCSEAVTRFMRLRKSNLAARKASTR